MIDDNEKRSALRASRIGIFAALYVVTSLIPISIFIGAPSFLALNLIITPIMAILLSPMEAFTASLIGGLIGMYIAPAQAMFGIFSILLPVAGATLGSLTTHRGKNSSLLTGGFLIVSILAYLIRNSSFPYFPLPHAVALFIVLYSIIRNIEPTALRIPLYAFVSTMCEQGMMMIFAVYLLGLPWNVFQIILPIMIYERLLATIGSTVIIISLNRVLPHFFTHKLDDSI